MDEYKRLAAPAQSWSPRERKSWGHSIRAALKRAVAEEPTEPELHPMELAYIEHLARCKELGLCIFCGAMPCSCIVIPDPEG